jgi:hypothetical protein
MSTHDLKAPGADLRDVPAKLIKPVEETGYFQGLHGMEPFFDDVTQPYMQTRHAYLIGYAMGARQHSIDLKAKMEALQNTYHKKGENHPLAKAWAQYLSEFFAADEALYKYIAKNYKDLALPPRRHGWLASAWRGSDLMFASMGDAKFNHYRDERDKALRKCRHVFSRRQMTGSFSEVISAAYQK